MWLDIFTVLRMKGLRTHATSKTLSYWFACEGSIESYFLARIRMNNLKKERQKESERENGGINHYVLRCMLCNKSLNITDLVRLVGSKDWR